MRLILEQRYLFDGSVVATSHGAHHHADPLRHDASAGAHPTDLTHGGTAPLPTARDIAESKTPAPAIATAPPAPPAPTSLLFVDPRVANWHTLADSVGKNVAVIVIDPARDGLEQVSDTLATRSNVGAVHFLTYGRAGEADLGTSAITAASLDTNAAQVTGWRDHLASHAQIDFWGCDVGAGQAGRAFVDRLHTLTGAGVAASTDATGAASLHGDWTLEQRAGVDHVRMPFSAAAIAAYDAVLDAPTPSVSFVSTAASTSPGSSFTDSITFQNTASSATGYGPFIDVFVPHNATDSATLSSAAYQRFGLGINAVTLTDSAPGHVGVVGGFHPLAKDAAGVPLFVVAPAGFAAGDTMYVVKLPVASIAPGDPGTKIDLTFSVDPATTASSSTPVNIAVVGGFQYAADPAARLSDTAIRGTSGTEPASASDAGNGLIAASTVVSVPPVFDTAAPTPVVGTLPPPGAAPQVYSVSTSFPQSLTDFTTGTLTLPGFDTTKGVLTDVTITFFASGSMTGNVLNGSATPQPASVMENSTLFVNSTDAAFANVTDTISAMQTYANANGMDNRIPAHGSKPFGPFMPSNTTTTDLGADANFAAGPVMFTVQTLTGSTTFGGGGNINNNVQTTEGGTVTATYTYSIPSVPNPVLTKTIGASNVPTQDNVDPAHPNSTIVIGETRPVTITVQLPNRTLTNGGSDVMVTDVLPTGESFASLGAITPSAGVTLGTGAGTATVTGNTVAFDLGSSVTNSNTDGTGSVTVTFNVNFPNGGNTDGTLLTDTAGLSYTGPAVTQPSVTLVEHDPAIVETIVDNTGNRTMGGQPETFTITLKNNGIVSGDVVAADASLPAGLTYVTNSLTYVSGGTTPTTDQSVPTDLKVGLASLDPGQTATFTFQATGSTTLAAGSSVTVSSLPAESTYKSVPAGVTTPGPRTYTLAASDTLTVPAIAPALTIVAEANGTASPTPSEAAAVLTTATTIGDIVRLHGTATIPTGTNAGTVLDFALPAGFRFDPNYNADLSVKIALVSKNGDLQSSTIDPTGTTAGLQVTGLPTATNFAPTFSIPIAAIDAVSTPGHVLINLGTLTNNDAGSTGNAVVLELNGIVANTAANVNGTSRAETLTVAGVTTGPVVETIKEPSVGITKTVTAVNTATNTATETVTLTNTGTATAYGVTLADPESTNENAITGLTTTGTGTGVVITSGNGTNTLGATLTLAPGASETFTYQVQVTNPLMPAPTVTATENYRDLVTSTVTLAGTTTGATGTATGGRDGVTAPAALNNYNGSVPLGLGAVSGTVYQALGNAPTTFDPTVDTTLGGVTVTARTAGPDGVFGTADDLMQTTTTAANGTYSFNLLPTGPVQITLPASGSGGLPGSETLVADPFGSIAVLPAAAATATAGTAQPGVNFGFELPDTAPVLGNFSMGSRPISSGTPIPLSSTGTATVVDTELNRLVGAGQSTYAGTQLVVQQYTGGAPAPNATDSFGGDGTLVFAGANVVLSGTTVGTFTETGGVLTITFNANATTSATIAGVLDHLSYTNGTPGVTAPITIGATLADGNTTGAQGTGGVMTSTPVFTMFNLTPPPAPTLTIVAEANGTASPTPTEAAPVLTTATTIGDIVRLHGVQALPEGTVSGTILDFTLPAGFVFDPNFAADGSVKIALVSPGGDLKSSTLDPTGTTAGLQVVGSAAGTNFAPTFTVPAGAIDTVTVPGHVRINLGTLTNNDGSSVQNAVVVELNGIIANTAADVNGTSLAETLAVAGVSTGPVTETVKEPTVGITKTVTAVNTATNTATETVTLTNTGTATAYGVTLNDPESSNENAITGLTTAGTGTGVVITSGNGTNTLGATLTLAPGASETFTYQVQVTNPLMPAPTVTATENYRDLVTSTVTLAGTTTGATGTATGGRDGVTAPAALNNYNGSVPLGLGAVSGTVYQALGNAPTTFDPVIDTLLPGVTVTARTAGPDGVFGTPDDLVQTTTTAANGTYSFNLLPTGPVQIMLPASGMGGLPGSETLVADPFGSIAVLPAAAATATAGTAQPGVNFGFELPDTAPVLGNFSVGTRSVAAFQPIQLSSTGAATVVDTELNRLGAEGVTYAGTQLVVQRITGGVASPATADTFGGDATLVFTGTNVVLGGTTVGTFTQAGGVLTITFNGAATTSATVAGVLDHLSFSTATGGMVTIGATLADGNTTGAQGTGGVMTSIPVLANFNVTATAPPTVALTIVGEANGTGSPTPTEAAPVLTTATTIGDIVRLHGVETIPEGVVGGTVLDFTLPAGFVFDPNFAADGSVKIALVSPGGDLKSSTLDPTGTTAGLQVVGSAAGTNFAPTFTVPADAIDAVSVPGHVRINLGTLTNNDGSPLQNAVVVELNGIIANTAADVNGTSLAETLAVGGLTTGPVTETVKEPTVGITKTVTAVNTATNTVTEQVTLTNSGTAIAYGVVFNDPESSNENPISGLVVTGVGGSATTVTSGNGTNTLAANLTINPGASVTFTYQVQVTNPLMPAPTATATENYRDLTTPTVTLAGTTTGATGTATGGRDGVTAPATLNTYNGAAPLGLGAVNGFVYQALGLNPTTLNPADTMLGGVTVTARTPGPDGVFGTPDDLVQTTTTSAGGFYTFNLLPTGPVQITLPASGAGGLPASETLVADPFGSTSVLPAAAATATAGTVQGGVNFGFELPDTAPVLGNFSVGTRPITAATPIPLSSTGAATVVDTELDRLVGTVGGTYAGAQLVVQRYTGGAPTPNATDSFGGDGTLVFAGTTVTLSGAPIGTFTQTGGVLSIFFNANSTNSATVAGVLDHLTYTTPNTNAFDIGRTIGATLADGNTAGAQGTGGVMTSAPVFTSFTLAPVPGSVTAAFIEPNDMPPAGNAVAVDPTLGVADNTAPGATFSQATVSITGNFVAGQDVLAFAPSAATGDITGSFVGTTLTLTSPGGAATPAQFQAALDAVQYVDTSDTPTTPTRTLTLGVTDKLTGVTTTAATVTLTVTPVNDSPILNLVIPVALAPATEDASNPPAGPVGVLVASIGSVGFNVADPDGANSSNGAPLITGGIAIVGTNTSLGNLYYSTNNGVTWVEFAGPGIAPVSAANALHLVADANTRIYFQPTVANFNGAVPNAIQYRAWDRFDPVANGGLAPLPTDSPLGTGINTGASSYSAAVQVIPEVVKPVNDAPVATGVATLPATTEDTSNPPGQTVATLFGPTFSDTVDQQQTGTNPTGSVANTLAGVAITGNTTPPSEGTWRYSVDGGTTFLPIPTTLSDTNALVLSSVDRISFLPAPNFNGAPPPLTARLIDTSTDVPLTAGITGATLATLNQAFPGVDVSGTKNGGITAISAGTVPLSTTVAPANDAPIATGTSTLPAIPEDSTNPLGATVTTLFGPNFTDTVDNQVTPINPTGSTANTLAGVAITGNPTPPSEGTWRYSIDGGLSFLPIPTNLSDSNALVLSNTARISFLPAPNFNGAPLPLTVRLVDSSTDVPLTGGITGAVLGTSTMAVFGVDVSGTKDGGITAVSATTVPLNTSVIPSNDAPVATGSATLPAVNQGAGNPPGQTVTTLFAPTFTDTADLQRTTINPTGTVSDNFGGVALTGNLATPLQGTYRFSVDGGTTFLPIPTNLSDTNALVLGGNVLIQFVPASGFSGIPGTLVGRDIDTSTDKAVVGATTGATLAGSTIVVGGVDVSGPNAGGQTAISANTVPLGTLVRTTDVSPLAGQPAVLPTILTGDTAPGGTVQALFGPSFSSPSGNALTGIVIVGDLATPAQGFYEYSVNGGQTFQPVPVGASVGSGLLLPANAVLSFVSANGFTGTPGNLVAYLVGGTSTNITPALRGSDVAGLTAAQTVDVSGLIGSPGAPITTNTVTLSLQVAPRTSTAVTPLPAVTPVAGQPGSTIGNQPSATPYLTSNPDTDRTRDGFPDPLRNLSSTPISRLHDAQGGLEWLVGTEIRRFVITDQLSVVDASADLFYGSVNIGRLTYRAQLPGGLPLPYWLNFDGKTLTLSGTPPQSAEGTLDVQIIAQDDAGLMATGEVHYRIGRQPRDLLALLRRAGPRPIRVPAALREPGPVRGKAVRPAARTAPGIDPDRPAPVRPAPTGPVSDRVPTDRPSPTRPNFGAAPAPMMQRSDAAPIGRSAFSAQLRASSGAGRAQALLEALTLRNPNA